MHLTLSDRTRGLLGAPELALTKPTTILVDTSRGPIVDRTPPVAALRRAVLTPHLGYVTERTYEVFWRDVVVDVAAWPAGNPVRVLGGWASPRRGNRNSPEPYLPNAGRNRC